MEKQTLEIGADGSLKLSIEGVAGKACTDLTAALERALGKTTGDTKTREFNAVVKQGEYVRANR